MKMNWDRKTCAHAGKCVGGLPQVFKVEDGKLAFHPDAASEEEIRATVAKCPSGALTLQEG